MLKNNSNSFKFGNNLIENSFVISNKDRGEASEYYENSIDSKI